MCHGGKDRKTHGKSDLMDSLPNRLHVGCSFYALPLSLMPVSSVPELMWVCKVVKVGGMVVIGG